MLRIPSILCVQIHSIRTFHVLEYIVFVFEFIAIECCTFCAFAAFYACTYKKYSKANYLVLHIRSILCIPILFIDGIHIHYACCVNADYTHTHTHTYLCLYTQELVLVVRLNKLLHHCSNYQWCVSICCTSTVGAYQENAASLQQLSVVLINVLLNLWWCLCYQ